MSHRVLRYSVRIFNHYRNGVTSESSSSPPLRDGGNLGFLNPFHCHTARHCMVTTSHREPKTGRWWRHRSVTWSWRSPCSAASSLVTCFNLTLMLLLLLLLRVMMMTTLLYPTF